MKQILILSLIKSLGKVKENILIKRHGNISLLVFQIHLNLSL